MQLPQNALMNKPLISLITVTFNAESLIAATLNSALKQSYQHFELVIVDGGSKDHTLDIARQFSSKTGALISEPDRGIYDAMNKGIKLAKGDWIYFLNAGDAFFDDLVLESIFNNESIAPQLREADLLYAKVKTKNEPTGIDYITGEPVTFSSFFNRYPICHQATFTRKRAFETIGYFDLKYKLAGDTEWFARFFRLQPSRAFYVNRIIAFYDIQGTTYHKRMKGYREYLNFGRIHFPWYISLKNYAGYPLLWIKVKLIRSLQQTRLFKLYRKWKFKGKSL